MEKYYADGQLAEVGGSAAMPVKYEYGADAGGVFTKEIKVVGGATNEWVKTYAHPFGGTKKVVYSAASGAPTHWYAYNNKGQLIEETDPDGVKTTYGYNVLGEQVTRITGDRRTDTVKDYTTDGGKDWERVCTWAWDGGQSNHMSTAWRALDGTETRSQAHSGDVTLTHRTVTAYPAATQRVATQYAPDDSYSVALYTNGFLAGQARYESGSGCLATNTFEYDPHGRLTSTTDERNGAETVQQYGEADLLVTNTVSGPGGLSQSSVFEYDSRGQVQFTTLPDGQRVTNTYYPTGLGKKTSGARTYPVEYGYDDQGRKTAMTTWQDAGGAGVDTVWIYDAYRGWLKEKKYDTSVQGPVYDYTDAGRLKTRTWARGIVTTYTTNLLGEIGEIGYGTNMAAVQFGHDYLGRVTSVTNGAMRTSLEYNNAGQLERESHSGGPLDGLSVSNTYDSLLRLQSVGVWQGGNLVASNSFTYDTASRLLTVSAGAFTGTYSYWPMSSLLSNIVFSYSGTNRLTTTRTYDGLDRLTGISSVPSASSAVAFSYGYNQANQRVAVTNADSSRWEHGYDFLGQVTNGVKKWSDNSTVAGQHFAYNFDDIGNRLWTTRDGHQTDYANNDLNQITARTVPGYANVLGSATNASKVTVNYQATDRKGDYFYKELAVTNAGGPVWLAVTNLAVLNNGTNADIIATNIGSIYLPPGSESLSYDADGNLTSDGRWNNGWDAENRLISQETTAAAVAAGVPKEKLDHAYDWRWRRIQKTVSAWNGSSWTNAYQRKFVYEGWNLQAELDGNGSLVHSFVWGNDASGSRQGAGGVGGLLAMIVHQGTNAGVYFYCYDGSHRVAALVDTNGVVVAEYEYGPFLELLRATGPLAHENPFLGTSKYYDWETGLYYYGYRSYDPSTGRWLSKDPLNERGGLNLCSFVRENPVDRIDALGLTDFPHVIDRETFYYTWNEQERQNWFRQFRELLADTIEKAASQPQYCVPKRLLAAVIANEMTDWDKNDGTSFDGLKGGGVGFAQISVSTAIAEDVSGISFTPDSAEQETAATHYGAVRLKLMRMEGNIDIAARLMRKYLLDLCSRSVHNRFGQGMISSELYDDCNTSKLCCSGLLWNCDKLVDFKPSPCLLKLMGAYWQSPKAMDALDKVAEGNYQAAYSMGLTCGWLDRYLEKLVK